MLQMQGAKFSRNEAYLAYVAVTRKLKQRSRWSILSRIRLKKFSWQQGVLGEFIKIIIVKSGLLVLHW